MITHRILSGIFVVGGLFRLYFSLLLVSDMPDSEMQLAIGCGILLGGFLCYLCASWIKRHQDNGVATLNLGVVGVIVLAIAVIGVLSLDSLIDANMVPHPCDFFSAGSDVWCAQQLNLLRVSAEVTWALSLFVWGLVYEYKIGYRLIYRIPFFERTT